MILSSGKSKAIIILCILLGATSVAVIWGLVRRIEQMGKPPTLYLLEVTLNGTTFRHGEDTILIKIKNTSNYTVRFVSSYGLYFEQWVNGGWIPYYAPPILLGTIADKFLKPGEVANTTLSLYHAKFNEQSFPPGIYKVGAQGWTEPKDGLSPRMDSNQSKYVEKRILT